MSVKRAFFSVFQKLTLFCCAMFFCFSNAFSANLPSGYTELEYIGTTGTQYIDTQAALTANFDLHATIEVVSTLTGLFIGSTNDDSGFFVGVYSSNLLNSGISRNVTNGGIPYPGKDIKFSFAISPTRFIGYNGVVRDLSRPYRGNGKLLIGNTETNAKVLFYSIKLYDGDNLSFNGVPAKRNSDGEIGMYDTVSNTFFTNQGTGTFTAGPAKCRNLFDGQWQQGGLADNGGGETASSVRIRTTFVPVKPNTTYNFSWVTNSEMAVIIRNAHFYDASNTWISRVNATTFTTPPDTAFVRFVLQHSNTTVGITPSDVSNVQLEQGSTATAYVPFCANLIKIATTAYNTARFNPVKTDLNNVVATIREIVTNTINQTAAIASLQADKQTRPEEQCPAGKKCLLVETEENGVIVPHWFPIIEAPTD